MRTTVYEYWTQTIKPTAEELEWLATLPAPPSGGACVTGKDLRDVVDKIMSGLSVKQIANLLNRHQQVVRQRETKASILIIQRRKAEGLDALFLSVRSYNCLKNEGCTSISQAIQMLDSGQLKKVPNLGKKSLAEIASKLEPFR